MNTAIGHQKAPTSVELRQERARIVEGMRGIIETAEKQNRDLSEKEHLNFKGYEQTFYALTQRIDRTEEQEQREAQLAKPLRANGAPRPDDGQRNERTTEGWLPGRVEYRSLRQERAVSSDGNPFLPTGQGERFFDRLRARSTVLSAGPRMMRLDEGELRIPKISASVTVSAVSENTPLPTSEPTFDAVTLTPRKIAALAMASNESLDDSKPELREVIATDLERQTATELDRQYLIGDGTGSNMIGLRNVSGATQMPLGTGDGKVPTLDDMAAAVSSLEAANASTDRAAWFMHPRTWATVRTFTDNTDRYQLQPDPGLAATKQLFGIPVYLSTQIPTDETVGTSSAASSVMLADMEQVAIGQRSGIEVAFSEDFAFDSDQTAIRVISRSDIGVINGDGLVIVTGVLAE